MHRLYDQYWTSYLLHIRRTVQDPTSLYVVQEFFDQLECQKLQHHCVFSPPVSIEAPSASIGWVQADRSGMLLGGVGPCNRDAMLFKQGQSHKIRRNHTNAKPVMQDLIWLVLRCPSSPSRPVSRGDRFLALASESRRILRLWKNHEIQQRSPIIADRNWQRICRWIQLVFHLVMISQLVQKVLPEAQHLNIILNFTCKKT